MTTPFLHVFLQEVGYHNDPTAVFATLCQDQKNTLLLESAEISSKNSLKSLLLINAALKISCLGQCVTFTALNDNGAALLPLIEQKLQPITQRLSLQHNQLITEFAPLSHNLDEDSKLQAPTIFDGLRCLTDLYKTSDTPIFLGGLFAYDLVANFIPIENITLQDDGLTCPDYVFYLAEQLLVLDHQQQQAQLHSFCFSENALSAVKQSAVQITQKLQKIEPHLTIQPASTEVSVNIEDEPFKDII
ncbi:anthranilate synthase component I, partial [Avibacterium paragallinarum]